MNRKVISRRPRPQGIKVMGVVHDFPVTEETVVAVEPGDINHLEVVAGADHALTPFIIASFASFIIPFIANCLVGSFLDA